jgi:hypothetical protein
MEKIFGEFLLGVVWKLSDENSQSFDYFAILTKIVKFSILQK